jgi:hypothetical protein
MNFSVAISHSNWVPARVASFQRLRAALTLDDTGLACVDAVQVFQDREPNWSWSEKMWRWASMTTATHCLFLQDDVIPMPSFWDALSAMVEANPDAIIGLETAHPAAEPLRDEGANWMTTADGLIGVAYVIPRERLKSFLLWRSQALKPGAVEAISEDSLIGLYAAHMGLKVWHPIPTIVDHDTSIPSTYGNEAHKNRRPSVKWGEDEMMQLQSSERWLPHSKVPHLGLYYVATPALLEKWLIPTPATPLTVQRVNADRGHAEARRIWYAKRGRMPVDGNQKRLFIAIPNRGTIHPETALSIWKLRGEEFLTEWDITDVRQESADICRIRARMVRHFLYETDATHLLFVDSDVAFGPEAIRGMLDADRDFVAIPYPRRDMIDFASVRKFAGTETATEALAYRYSCRLVANPPELDDAACAEVEAMPLGCALLSRKLLTEMTVKALTFNDELTPGVFKKTAALFNLLMGQNDGLLSEDYSFCARVRAMGSKVWMYLGLGSPASHHGSWSYHGDVESFGYRREKVAP